MKTVFILLGAAAFFGILAWVLDRRRNKPFVADTDVRVPFSYREQERVRMETPISHQENSLH